MPTTSARRADGSMALLVDLMRSPDPAYADAAAARAAARADGDAARPSRRVAAVAAVAAVGLVAGAAVAAVRGAAGDRGATRSALVTEVQQRTADTDDLTRRAARLRADVVAAQVAADGGTGRPALELAAGTSAVVGPGIVAVLDDAPAPGTRGAPPRGSAPVGSGRVLDRDLQALVNAVWAAGAEAVSVSDLRVTTRTAIRSAGQSVLVDYRPLSPPYVVRAVGDPDRLQAELADSPAGRRLRAYAAVAGLRLDVRGADALALPAGTVPEPRAVTPGAGS